MNHCPIHGTVYSKGRDGWCHRRLRRNPKTILGTRRTIFEASAVRKASASAEDAYYAAIRAARHRVVCGVCGRVTIFDGLANRVRGHDMAKCLKLADESEWTDARPSEVADWGWVSRLISTIKACAWCGKRPAVGVTFGRTRPASDDVGIWCDNKKCVAHGVVLERSSLKTAIRAWNKRPAAESA